MKNNTKNVLQTIASILLGIVVYIVEFVLIYGLVKLICKIVDFVRARKLDKHAVKIPDNADLDTKPVAKTTWEKIKPLFEDPETEAHPRTVKAFEKITNLSIGAWAQAISDNFSHDTYATLIYDGRDLDIIFTTRGTIVLENTGYEYDVDEDFLRMRILKPSILDRVVEVVADGGEGTKAVETAHETTWDMVKPYTFKSDDNIDPSIFKVWEDATMREVVDNILRYYICKKALVSVIYKGKALDVWITPGMKIAYLDRDEKVRFEIDEEFLNMKVKRTNENIHLALVED